MELLKDFDFEDFKRWANESINSKPYIFTIDSLLSVYLNYKYHDLFTDEDQDKLIEIINTLHPDINKKLITKSSKDII